MGRFQLKSVSVSSNRMDAGHGVRPSWPRRDKTKIKKPAIVTQGERVAFSWRGVWRVACGVWRGVCDNRLTGAVWVT